MTMAISFVVMLLVIAGMMGLPVAPAEAAGGITFGQVGSARSQLMSQRALVDHAVNWIQDHVLNG